MSFARICAFLCVLSFLASGCENQTTQVAPKSSNADLSALSAGSIALSPAFSLAVTEYQATVPYSTASVTLTATASDAKATLSGDNGITRSLAVGANELAVTVTAEDGSTVKRYEVTITRSPSADSSLLSLTVSPGALDPAFSPSQLEYDVALATDIASIQIAATASDSANASVSITPASPVTLGYGLNTVSVTVTAQDGHTETTYAVRVTRESPPLSSNAALSSLSIDGIESLNPAFSQNTFNYTISVPDSVSGITVRAVKADEQADLSGSVDVSLPLAAGLNSFSWTVTAEDGVTERTYSLRAYRGSSSPTLGGLSYVPAGTYERKTSYANYGTRTVGAFYMGRHEVTRAEFFAVMGTDPSDTSISATDSCPAQNVNWYRAIAFCNKLSILEDLDLAYSVEGVDFETLVWEDIPSTSNAAWDAAVMSVSASGYRLPTVSEWEWAAMAADSYSGGAVNATGFSGYAGQFPGFNYTDISWCETTACHEVGGKLPNALLLYDLGGNASEWCHDWVGTEETGNFTDYAGVSTGTRRSTKGGSVTSGWMNLQISSTPQILPEKLVNTVGLRVIRK